MLGFKAGKSPISAGLSVILNVHIDHEYQVLRAQNCEKGWGGTVIKSLPRRDSMEGVLVLELIEVRLVFDQRPRSGDPFHVLFPDHHQS